MHKYLILLFKWWWRFSESDNTQWKNILKFVHEIKGLKASSETFSGVRDGTWAHLLSNESDTSKIRSIIEEGMIVKVGNGNSMRFWHDRWCEAGMLKMVFPRLYSISMQKNFHISQMGNWHEGLWTWHLAWRRNLYGWENDEVANLKFHIEQIRPKKGMEDGVIWKHSRSLCYPVKNIVAKVNEAYARTLPKPITNIVWQKYILQEHNCMYGWQIWKKLKLVIFLQKRGLLTYSRQFANCMSWKQNQILKYYLDVDYHGVIG